MIAPNPTSPHPGGAGPHILTIGLEDYFQVGAFNRFVQRDQWYRFESRVEQTTLSTLALLEQHGAKATFFVLGWVAKRYPELIRAVVSAGHEVATKGYYHRSIRQLSPDQFRDDCLMAKGVVEDVTGKQVLGYRLADGWFAPRDLWALDTLAECGFAYDSSLAPAGSAFAEQKFRRHVHSHQWRDRVLTVVPVSVGRAFGVPVPVAGGNYLRQLPWWVTRRMVAKWERAEASPLVAYFHVWELDPDQPKLSIGSRLTHARHYRNLDKMAGRLARLLGERSFTSVAESLGLDAGIDPGRALPLSGGGGSDTGSFLRPPLSQRAGTLRREPAKPLTVIVPCYNEAESLRYLANTLERVRQALADDYEVKYLIVEDGSADETWPVLEATFRGAPHVALVRHPHNLGVAAAIMTGLRRADTELVASMDCDCTYDPLGLPQLLAKLVPGVDMVTASPYHPEGRVRNVPRWRLGLSKSAAWMYRRIVGHQLYTYTSCFRAYRRTSVAGINLAHGGFLGVAELVAKLDLIGGRIVEHPATLEVRMLGRSKMKTVRTVFGHLGLMSRLARMRLKARWSRAPRDLVLRSVVRSHTPETDERPVLFRPAAELAQQGSGDVRKLVLPTHPSPAPPH